MPSTSRRGLAFSMLYDCCVSVLSWSTHFRRRTLCIFGVARFAFSASHALQSFLAFSASHALHFRRRTLCIFGVARFGF